MTRSSEYSWRSGSFPSWRRLDPLGGRSDEPSTAAGASEQVAVDDTEQAGPAASPEAPARRATTEAAGPTRSTQVVDDDGDADGIHGDGAVGRATAPEGRRARRGEYGPLESIGRKPRAFIIPVAVLGTIGLLLGLVRQPVFTARAELNVGGVVGDFEPTQGQVAAIHDLADIYSRLVGSAAHLTRVEEALGEPVPPSALSAAPVPDSRLVRLEATGADDAEATARADAAARELVALVESLQDEVRDRNEQLLEALDQANAELAQVRSARDAAQIAHQQAIVTGPPPAVEPARQALVAAEAQLAALQLRVDVASSNYQRAEGVAGGGISLAIFSGAASWGSDRRDQLAILTLGGMVLGALVGMALATLAANRWHLMPAGRRPGTGG